MEQALVALQTLLRRPILAVDMVDSGLPLVV
jgi:hypothetical protein